MPLPKFATYPNNRSGNRYNSIIIEKISVTVAGGGKYAYRDYSSVHIVSTGDGRRPPYNCGDKNKGLKHCRLLQAGAYPGLTPEELARKFPHLTLSQIHDALSYYYEHQQKIDQVIDEESEENIKGLLGK